MLLAREELLLLKTTFALTALTAKGHLSRAWLPFLQVVPCNISESPDKGWVAIQALGTFDTGTVRFLHDFEVQLVESLDVIAGEGDGYEDQIRMSPLHIFHHSVTRLSSEPRRGANLRLPAQAVRIAEVEALHHCMNCRSNFGRVGVA